MIRIRQIKLQISHNTADLEQKICKILHLLPEDLLSYQLIRRSIDARKKPELYYTYTVDVSVRKEKQVMRRIRSKDIFLCKDERYQLPVCGTEILKERPVVIGSGPAGRYCAFFLVVSGYRPLHL